MNQAEKLKAALTEAEGMDEIALARRMKVSPGRMVAVTRGWTELEQWERITAEVLLGLERGALKGDAPAMGLTPAEEQKPVRPGWKPTGRRA